MITDVLQLTVEEARVLGCLIEKEATTPEYYPLSLNALMNACNQRSNRDPVMDLDEEGVRQAVHGLEELRLAGPARSAEGRVIKYEHWLGEAFNFTRAEQTLIGVLLLRGPQTPGELRGRSERMHLFEQITDVIAGLQKLIERQPPLVGVLPRQPGTKESRYAHLFFGTLPAATSDEKSTQGIINEAPSRDERLATLEATVAELRTEITALREQMDRLIS